MSKKTVLITSLVALVASPGLAKAPKNAPAEPVYCIKYERETGSRIAPQQACKTKKQWSEQGVDIDQLLKK